LLKRSSGFLLKTVLFAPAFLSVEASRTQTAKTCVMITDIRVFSGKMVA
jgi:hypothetical protein